MELSEEEKEAKLELNKFIYGKQLSKDDIVDYLSILFNLIDKQQKEIEDLKEITQNYNAIGGETFGDDRIIVCSMKYFDDGFFKKNYIFKDKIREKIEHYNNELEHIKNGEEFENEKPMYYWGKVALENLLEDN